MKICLATTSFPRWAGDHRSPYILEAARAIERQGHSVRVVTLHYPGARIRENLDGIEVIRTRYLPDKWEILQKEDGGMPVMWRKYPLARLSIIPLVIAYTLSIARHAKDCDLIHANWTLSGICAWLGQIWHRKPFVVTVQGSDINQGLQIPLVRFLTQLSFRASAKVLCLSRSLADTVASLGVADSKIQVIPNGVDTDRFVYSDEERQPVALFVGAMIEGKGIRFLLNAFLIVLQQFPGFRLVLVGAGPQQTEFRGLAESLGLADRVDFIGSISQLEVSRWMRRARFFVLPSLAEGLGVVLLEALASGTPCIGTKVGGIPDVITEQVGLLVPPADSFALANAMLQILNLEDGQYKEMCRQARSRAVRVFSWQTVARQISAIYRQVKSVERERTRSV